MLPTRMVRLEGLGFAWEPFDGAWEIMFTTLRLYRDKYGHCNVPDGCVEDPKLGAWVGLQRRLEKKGTLSPNRKARLEDLGFIWEARNSVWETMFNQLRRYKEWFGDCNVPQAWKENPPLGMWVHRQRVAEKKGELLPERKARLDALGFEWNSQANKRRPAAE